MRRCTDRLMMTLETCEADQWRERAGAGLSIIALIRGLKRERLGYPRNPCGVMVTTMVTNSAGWEGEGGTKQHQQPKKSRQISTTRNNEG
jgi:hypothetical protein